MGTSKDSLDSQGPKGEESENLGTEGLLTAVSLWPESNLLKLTSDHLSGWWFEASWVHENNQNIASTMNSCKSAKRRLVPLKMVLPVSSLWWSFPSFVRAPGWPQDPRLAAWMPMFLIQLSPFNAWTSNISNLPSCLNKSSQLPVLLVRKHSWWFLKPNGFVWGQGAPKICYGHQFSRVSPIFRHARIVLLMQ